MKFTETEQAWCSIISQSINKSISPIRWNTQIITADTDAIAI